MSILHRRKKVVNPTKKLPSWADVKAMPADDVKKVAALLNIEYTNKTNTLAEIEKVLAA